MDEYNSGPSLSALFLLALIIVLVAVIGLLIWNEVSGSQAEQSRQAAIQEQARAEQARQQTEQVRIQEEQHTERWQSFLIAMKTVSSETPIILLVVLVSLEIGALLFLEVRRR